MRKRGVARKREKNKRKKKQVVIEREEKKKKSKKKNESRGEDRQHYVNTEQGIVMTGKRETKMRAAA